MRKRPGIASVLGCVVVLALSGCVPRSSPVTMNSPAVISEAWESERAPVENIDSLAIWQNGDGGAWVFATAKATDRIAVLDAATGRLVRWLGSSGNGPGEFRRPNGVAVVDDTLIIVERDNHRIQYFSLPELEPLGTAAAGILRLPYGIAAFPMERGEMDLYVTDNFDAAPGSPELGERVRHFRVRVTAGGLETHLIRNFGDLDGPGALHKVETIAADPERGLLLIADEETERMGLRIYTLDGDFTGEMIQGELFGSEPEGIALYECGEGGYWVLTDQHPERTRFHVIERESFDHLGSFVGRVTANTDGVTAASAPLDRFANGAFFAVHDDQSVTAFDWDAVSRELNLPACRGGAAQASRF